MNRSISKNFPTIREAFIDSFPVSTAYIPLGMLWGFVSEQAGIPPLWGVFYSISIYAGVSQLLGLSLLLSDTSLIEIFFAVIPVSFRNTFYTITAINRLPKKWAHKLFAAFGLVDTSFAILLSKEERVTRDAWYTLPLTFFIYFYWVLGTVIGVLFGGHIPDGIESLDFSLPALLLVLAMEQHRKVKSWIPLCITAVAIITTYTLIKQYWLIAALAICTISTILSPNKKEPGST